MGGRQGSVGLGGDARSGAGPAGEAEQQAPPSQPLPPTHPPHASTPCRQQQGSQGLGGHHWHQPHPPAPSPRALPVAAARPPQYGRLFVLNAGKHPVLKITLQVGGQGARVCALGACESIVEVCGCGWIARGVYAYSSVVRCALTSMLPPAPWQQSEGERMFQTMMHPDICVHPST